MVVLVVVIVRLPWSSWPSSWSSSVAVVVVVFVCACFMHAHQYDDYDVVVMVVQLWPHNSYEQQL